MLTLKVEGCVVSMTSLAKEVENELNEAMERRAYTMSSYEGVIREMETETESDPETISAQIDAMRHRITDYDNRSMGCLEGLEDLARKLGFIVHFDAEKERPYRVLTLDNPTMKF